MKSVIRCKSELGEEGYIEGDFCLLDKFHGLKLTDPWKKKVYDDKGKVVGFYMLPQPDEPGWVGYTGNKRWITFAEYDKPYKPKPAKPYKPITYPCQHRWKTIEGDHSICTKCKVESHQRVGNQQMVAIGLRNWEKLKKAGKLEDRSYFVFQTWGEQKAKIIANIIINDMMKHSSEKGCKVNELGLSSYDIWWFSELIFHNVLDRTKVTKVIDHFMEFGGEVKDIIDQLGLWPTYEDGALEEAVDKVIADNPKAVKEILAGKMKAYGFLMGRLKQDDKNIDSKEAMSLLKEKIHEQNLQV